MSGETPSTNAEPAPAEAPVEFVPLTAEAISIPEGFEIDAAQRDSFLSLANEHKIPAEVANKLVAFQADLTKAAAEKHSEAWAGYNQRQVAEVQADPEIGGEKLTKEVLPQISKLLNEYGSPALRDALTSSGAGNNIEVVRFLHKLAGKLVVEGSPVSGTPPQPETSLAEMLYPSMKKA